MHLDWFEYAELMRMLTFSFLDQKNPLRAILDQKFKISCLKWILVPGSEYAVFDGDAHFMCFRLKMSILEKLGQKIKNCFFKLKRGTWNNLNGDVHFCFLRQERPFRVNFIQQLKTVCLSYHYVPRLIWMFWIWPSCLLFLLEWKFCFWVNLFQKFKMACLSLNLVLRLIQMENCMVRFNFSDLH